MNTKTALHTLLLGTALSVPFAIALPASAQDAESCAELERLLESDLPEGIERTEEEIAALIEANDLEQCRLVSVQIVETRDAAASGEATDGDAAEGELAAVEDQRIRISDEVAIQGRVYVDQATPQVELQGGDTEVVVGEANPTVTVREAGAQILVRQAAPTITVQMPQPTITIEQQAPEIIITMPRPGVDVANARPTVEVRQSEPQVRVSQAAPTVELELSTADDAENSPGILVEDRMSGQEYATGTAGEITERDDVEVTMSQSEPVVTFQEASGDMAENVTYERAEPTVSFESAEPTVEFTSAGEPVVEFTQAGEPNVTFQESEGETEMAAAEAPVAEEPATEEPAASLLEEPVAEPEAEVAETEVLAEPEAEVADTAAVTTTAPAAAEMTARDGYTQVAGGDYDAQTLIGARVYGAEDEDLGEIGDLVLVSDGTLESVIIDVGGFLGLGEKPVQIAFDQLDVMRSEAGDLRVFVPMTEEELESMPRYEG